jgi:hypothetical protein
MRPSAIELRLMIDDCLALFVRTPFCLRSPWLFHSQSKRPRPTNSAARSLARGRSEGWRYIRNRFCLE